MACQFLLFCPWKACTFVAETPTFTQKPCIVLLRVQKHNLVLSAVSLSEAESKILYKFLIFLTKLCAFYRKYYLAITFCRTLLSDLRKALGSSAACLSFMDVFFYPKLVFLSVSLELCLAKEKWTRMSPFCHLGLQMHLLGVVLRSGLTDSNYSIRETSETIKRARE